MTERYYGDRPAWASDQIITHVDIHLDWRDIPLLIFRRGRMAVDLRIWTEELPGRVESRSRLQIDRIIPFWEKHPGGYSIAPKSDS